MYICHCFSTFSAGFILPYITRQHPNPLHFNPEYGESMFFRNAGIQPEDYTARQCRRSLSDVLLSASVKYKLTVSYFTLLQIKKLLEKKSLRFVVLTAVKMSTVVF
jgi:hypothetical protein